MKRYTTRQILITKLAALVLFTLCFAQSVSAQYSGTHVLYQDIFIPSVGLVPGQSLRLTLFNPDGAPVRAQVKLHHSGGMLVALGDGSVRMGTFHSFDFKRNDIPLPGEAGTGRIQLGGSVRLTFSEAISPVAISMETITDGTSNTVFTMEKPPSPGGSEYDIATGNRKKGVLMGIVPGQTLRLNVFHPHDKGATSLKTVPVKVSIYDALGNLIAQSAETAIPADEFRSFDFNRAAFHLPGEPGTGRLQVRAVVEGTFTLTFTGQTSSEPLSISSELVENATGKTKLYNPNTGVFFLRNSNSP